MARKIILGIIIFILVAGLVLVGFIMLGNKEENQSYTNQGTDTNTTKKDQQSESSIPEGYTRYEAEELAFSFAYPEEWGTVSRRETTNSNTNNNNETQWRTVSYNVGPLYMVAYEAGSDLVDTDDPVVGFAQGFIRDGDDYYARFVRQQSMEEAKPLNGDRFDYFERVDVGERTALILGDNCTEDPSCGLYGIVNLSNDSSYPGLSMRYDRAFEQEGVRDFNESARQLERVVRTFEIER